MNRAELKSILKELDEKELRELIIELHALNPTNAYHISLYLKGSDNPDIIELCNKIKARIDRIYNNSLNYRNLNIKINMVKNLVKESETSLKDFPFQKGEIYLEFCHKTLVFLKRFGLINMTATKLVISYYEKCCLIIAAITDGKNELKNKAQAVLKLSYEFDEFLSANLDLLYKSID